ncbi:MAG TPA: glycosyltransferase [Candidatus Dormibacteraeota bacterium]|nr:glycosyltransferase [Candidatus Dormibacteraeota bacterium]
MNAPKVSVSLITYNQAPYIAQALKGALMQQTAFPFEIVVGEDKSTDGTREIVKDYAARFPERIRLLLHERKTLSYANGKPTGNWNFANNIKTCAGQYIALLDGDDYWTSPDKLQKQADFLDANGDCAICYHNVRVLDEAQPDRIQLHETKPGKKSLKNLLRGNFMHTCSVMFRAGLFEKFPDWFFKSPLGDWPLHVLNARHGNIGYIDEVLGVYRKHPSGGWSQNRELEVRAGTIQAAELLRECLAPADQHYLDRQVLRWYRKLIEACKAVGDREAEAKFGQAREDYQARFPSGDVVSKLRRALG